MPASSSTSASGATPCFGRWPVTVACSVRTAQSSARRCRCSEAVRAALPDRRQRCGIRRPRLLRRAGAFVFSIDPLALTLLQILKSLVWTSGSTRQSPRPPHQPVAATTAARRPPQGRRHWPAATATRLYFEPGDRFGNFAAGCRFRVCAVKRRRFPVGASPTRQPLQPEATGAGMEVTKCLKPSGRRATNWWQRECAGRNASER
jgi:hypothetical protein